jgi:hypothetical protein
MRRNRSGGAGRADEELGLALRSCSACTAHLVAAALAVHGFIFSIAHADAPKPGETPIAQVPVEDTSEAAFDTFLNRLMRAESGGNDNAANPRSTALGPFQFIKTTFVETTRRHFAAEIAAMTDEQVLALRTDPAFSRRAAAAYCKDLAVALREQGLSPNYTHLRLAFLVGPAAAARVMQAESSTAVSVLLGPAVVRANPFMTGMTVAGLMARAARDLRDRDGADAPAPVARPPAVRIAAAISPRADARAAEKGSCNEKLVSCRRFTYLRSLAKTRVAEAPARQRGKPSQRKRT